LTGGADQVKGTLALGYGKTETMAFIISATGSVGRTVPSSASTGYYKMTICYDWEKVKLDK